MKKLCFVSLCALLLGLPVALRAEESVLWKDVDGWSVRADPSLGNACYIATSYQEGTTLRLGFDFSGNQKQIYFALGNARWKSLEAGKEYPIKVQFDRSPIWDATATARDIGTSMLLVATTTDTNFVAEFAKKLTVRAEFNGRQIAKLRLDRSAKAITAMLDCQRAVNEVTAKSAPSPSQSDPFEQTPKSEVKSSDDPFDL
ncbi:hypothetical protein [Rhizobium phaseoli]|uniref:hypothetical protein n=1 Tax=Rhizobium phaseoli TaxID=396 RepID=UPI0007EAB250|nr:hypothetical protein [Rhizobium phaseoli]